MRICHDPAKWPRTARLLPHEANLEEMFIYYINLYCFEVIKVADLPIAAVVRIAKKNGAERVGSDAAAALVAKSEDYIADLVRKGSEIANHAGRKTLKKEDIYLAAEKK